MDRRKFIASAGVVIGMGVAGCSALSGDENGKNNTKSGGNNTSTPRLTTVSENASFARLNIGGPSNVTVGDEFNIPISVANVGGKNGTFSGKLVITEGSASLNRTFAIENVGSREIGKTMVKSLNFTHSDTYTFSIEGTNVTKTITVEPITLSLGQSHTLGNGLKATVKSAKFQPALFYTVSGSEEETEQTQVLSASSGHTLMIVHLGLENVSTDGVEFSINPDSGRSSEPTVPPLLVEQGNWYTSFADGISLSTAKNIKEKPLTNAQLQPGAQTSGWLLAQVPRKVAKQTVSISHQRNGKNTPPEIQWQVPPQSGSKRTFPKFTLDTFKMPESSEIAAGTPYTVKVTNEGAAPGTFRGVLEFKTNKSQSYSEAATLSAKLKPGESKTFKGEHKWWYLTSNTYRLRPFGKTKIVGMKPASFRYGQTYTARYGRQITVSKPVIADKVGLPGHYAGPAKAGSGQQWVLVKVKAAVSSKVSSVPSEDVFTLQINDQSYEPDHPGIGESSITSPVSGDIYSDIYNEATSGNPATGYICFKIPSNSPVSDITTQMKIDVIDYPPYVATWGTGTGKSATQSK